MVAEKQRDGGQRLRVMPTARGSQQSGQEALPSVCAEGEGNPGPQGRTPRAGSWEGEWEQAMDPLGTQGAEDGSWKCGSLSTLRPFLVHVDWCERVRVLAVKVQEGFKAKGKSRCLWSGG